VAVSDFTCPEGIVGLEVTGSRNENIAIASDYISAENSKIIEIAEQKVTFK
jgi:hypothetical protein